MPLKTPRIEQEVARPKAMALRISGLRLSAAPKAQTRVSVPHRSAVFLEAAAVLTEPRAEIAAAVAGTSVAVAETPVAVAGTSVAVAETSVAVAETPAGVAQTLLSVRVGGPGIRPRTNL